MVETKQDLGLTVLTSSAVFGAWSAWNSSLFTAATFVTDEEKYRNAKLAMDLGLATAIATGAGVWAVYGEKGKVAAAAAVLTGAVLYAAYWCKLRSNPNLAMLWNKNKGQIQTQKLSNIDSWKPLTDKQLQEIRNLVNSSQIEIVSEP